MWLMLQQDEPDDYVLATGQACSVRSFAEWAFAEVGITLDWRGEDCDDKGHDAGSGRLLIEIDPRYFRLTEADHLQGDAGKARQRLGWSHEVTARELVREMVAADLADLRPSGAQASA